MRARLAIVCVLACGDAAPPVADACDDPVAVVTVVRVVDGDTIDLEDGRRVRIIGVDAPELSVDECFADDAREYLTELVLGRGVLLTRDEAACEDRYGRTLAHVETPDGDAAQLLVTRGYACAYYFPPAGKDVRADLADREARARYDKRGLWGVTCAGRLPECAQ